MVIVVEEQNKNRVGIGRILSWVILLILVGVGAYYVFFESPTLIEFSGPPNFPDTQQFVQLKEKLHPEDVSKYQIIQDKKFVEPPTNTSLGRYNPFLPY